MPTVWGRRRRTRHGDQALGSRTLRVAPHDLARERAPLPLPDVCSRVASKHEPSGRSTRQALTLGGALGAGGPGGPPSDGGAYRPGPRRVLEYRQHRCPDRRPAHTHQRPDSVRWRACHRC